jgi:predicted DNA-binding WGR domain protein
VHFNRLTREIAEADLSTTESQRGRLRGGEGVILERENNRFDVDFFRIHIDGSSWTTRSGKVGAKGRSRTRRLDTPDDALEDALGQIAQRARKGYQEVLRPPIGARLKAVIKAAKKRKSTLANYLGVPTATLSAWEKDQAYPLQYHLELLRRTLGDFDASSASEAAPAPAPREAATAPAATAGAHPDLEQPADKKAARALVKARRDDLKAFKASAGPSATAERNAIAAYLSARRDDVPPIPAARVEPFEIPLGRFFNPWKDWTFIDDRALAVCASQWRFQQGLRHGGFFRSFCLWANSAVERADAPGWFPQVVDRLVAHGLSAEDIVPALLDGSAGKLVVDGEPTALGRYVAGVCEQRAGDVVAQALAIGFASEGPRAEVAALLHRAGLARPHLEALTAPYRCFGKWHPPLNTIAALVALDAGAYEGTWAEALKSSPLDCMGCAHRLIQLQVAHYPRRRLEGLEHARRVLAGRPRVGHAHEGQTMEDFLAMIRAAFGEAGARAVAAYEGGGPG